MLKVAFMQLPSNDTNQSITNGLGHTRFNSMIRVLFLDDKYIRTVHGLAYNVGLTLKLTDDDSLILARGTLFDETECEPIYSQGCILYSYLEDFTWDYVTIVTLAREILNERDVCKDFELCFPYALPIIPLFNSAGSTILDHWRQNEH